jgi:hypothetical protein
MMRLILGAVVLAAPAVAQQPAEFAAAVRACLAGGAGAACVGRYHDGCVARHAAEGTPAAVAAACLRAEAEVWTSLLGGAVDAPCPAAPEGTAAEEAELALARCTRDRAAEAALAR